MGNYPNDLHLLLQRNKPKQQLKFPPSTQMWAVVFPPFAFLSAFSFNCGRLLGFWLTQGGKIEEGGHPLHSAAKCQSSIKVICFNAPQPHISRCCAFRNGQTLIAVEGLRGLLVGIGYAGVHSAWHMWPITCIHFNCCGLLVSVALNTFM